MRWVLLSFLAVVIGFIIGIPFYLGPDDISGCKRPVTTSARCAVTDAIVAVSGGDTAARASEAVGLYEAGWAPRIIFSGAAQDPKSPSNALAMKRLAMEQGVPESAIIIEETSRTTAENADNTTQLILGKDIDNIILVTSAYHQRRAFLEFGEKLGEGVKIRNHPVASDKQWGPGWWVTPGGWWLVGSELAKIIGFYTGASHL